MSVCSCLAAPAPTLTVRSDRVGGARQVCRRTEYLSQIEGVYLLTIAVTGERGTERCSHPDYSRLVFGSTTNLYSQFKSLVSFLSSLFSISVFLSTRQEDSLPVRIERRGLERAQERETGNWKKGRAVRGSLKTKWFWLVEIREMIYPLPLVQLILTKLTNIVIGTMAIATYLPFCHLSAATTSLLPFWLYYISGFCYSR